jgi:hypothetical protein
MDEQQRNPYRRVLGAPHVLSLAMASVLARIPVAMAGVALVIFVHDRTGSFAAAGAVAGAYTIGLGGTGPLLGRYVDRRGARRILPPCAALASLALAAVVILGDAGAGTVPMLLAAGVSGAACPPVGGLLRHLWPLLVEQQLLVTAYVTDSLLIEAVFVTGPLLTGLLVATVGPAGALYTAAAFSLAGTLWFVSGSVVAEAPRTAPHEHTRAGALASRVLRLLVLTGIPFGAALGALDVALPAFGVAHGSAALGGPFTAALATGSALGALVYGAQSWRLGDPARALVALAIVQPLAILPLLLAASTAAMLALGVLAGSFIAPTITARNQIAQLAMPRGTGTEAFTWLSLSVVVGASAGSALAGPRVQAGGWRAGVALACALPALGLPLILARRSLLRSGLASEVRLASAASGNRS